MFSDDLDGFAFMDEIPTLAARRAAIAEAKARHGARFAVRWSNGGGETDCTVPVQAIDEPVNAIVCPEQTGATTACATCALCWTTKRNIAFIEH